MKIILTKIGIMKAIKKCFSIMTITCSVLAAQAQDQYDIVSYTAPKEWKKEDGQNFTSYSRIDGGSWSQIAIYKSVASKGSIEADAQSEWESLVLSAHSIGQEDQSKPEQAEGWYVMSKSGVWQYNGANVATILTVYSNNSVCVSVLCNATAQPYLKNYTDFVKTIELNAGSVVSEQTTPVAEDHTTGVQTIGPITGLWGSYINETSGSLITGGYFRKEYKFNEDGTYTFMEKNFSAYNPNIVFKYETGNWQVNGNQLTITPVEGRTELWSKNASGRNDELGKKIQAKKMILETITYNFEINYLSGMEKNYLQLTHNSSTQRDGSSTNNDGEQHTFQYSSVSVDAAMIKMP